MKAINCIVVGVPWSIGYSVTALIAQLTRDWFHMLIVIVGITAPWPLGSFSFIFYFNQRELINKLQTGSRTSARVNFGTRTSAQISKNLIDFGTRNPFALCRS